MRNNNTSRKEGGGKYLNHALLSLACGVGLILILVTFTEIAGNVLTVVGLITTLVVFLFPGIKNLGHSAWFLKKNITLSLIIVIAIQVIYLIIALLKPGDILLRIVRIEAQTAYCGAYCAVILEGKGIDKLHPGDNLLVYGPQARLVDGNWSESPIALIRVVSLYDKTAIAQVVLIHEKAESDETRQITPGLRVELENDYNLDYLIPSYGDGYVYQDLVIYLHPNSKVDIGDFLVVMSPQFKGERIVDFQTTTTELKIVSIGQNRVSAQTELISGTAPLTGDLVMNKPKQEILNYPFEPKVMFISNSVFELGRENSNVDERPLHSISLSDYYVSVNEVTNFQYAPFIIDGGYYDKKYWTEDGWSWKNANLVEYPKYWNDPIYNRENYPVVGVSWYEAIAYANWLSNKTGKLYRLLTEAEWERVACGNPKTLYPWGSNWNFENANFADLSLLRQEPSFTWADSSHDDGYIYTAPVGNYPAGASVEGVVDLAGNVWEWTSSLYQDYPYLSNDGRENLLSPGLRVTRGGGWGSDSVNLRCTTRGPQQPDYQTFIVGFRLAREP